MKAKELISKTAFWDVDFDQIDLEKDRHFVVHKIFNFGTLEDIKKILKYIWQATVKKELLNANYLNNQALWLASAIFSISPQQFSCYLRKQSNQEQWPY